MALDFKKFARLDDVIIFLKGHLLGSADLVKSKSSLYLHGLTLIFTTPAETVTFAASPASAQVPLTLAQVKAQIEAQTTGVVVEFNMGRLELYMATPGAIGIDKDGTANPLLGFATSADMAATPYAEPGGTAPALVQIVPDTGSNSYLVVVDNA